MFYRKHSAKFSNPTNYGEAFAQIHSYIIFTLNKAATPVQDNFTPTKLLYQKSSIKKVEYHQKRIGDNLFPGNATYERSSYY